MTRKHTLTAGIRLYKSIFGTGFLELRRQPSQLGQHFVDDPNFGGQIVLMDIFRDEAANIPCKS
jgi:hypothetical protein